MPRILLAEDNGEMRQLLAGQLRLAGYEVVECRDGEQLVERLASTFLPTRNRHGFDLVVSDIRMPGFSGLEVLDGLHDCEDFPPMILITAFGDQATHARARLLGAAATLDKPFRIPELLAIVQRQIERRRRGWRTGATAAPSSLDITPPSPSDPHDNVNHEED
ncbi:MAG: response regulator [Planctomycetes bacterium]|nr:response regulator [Planctomycetota bacterium]